MAFYALLKKKGKGIKMQTKQGSNEWLELRKGKITASKIPIILGISPYQTPKQLWEEELGFRTPQEVKQHMLDGLAAEKEMADFFYDQTGIEVVPEVVFHKENPKFMASLDGINLLRTIITEYKNNNREYHEMARKGKPVDFHVIQMQWQMFCEGEHIQAVHYISRNAGEKIIVIVSRDNDIIKDLEKQALEFLRMIEDLEEPPLTDRDYEDVSDNFSLALDVKEYAECCRMVKHYTELSECVKNRIVSESKDRNVKGVGWKLTKSSRKGNLDYDKILGHYNIDKDLCQHFRKPSTISYRITTQSQ